MKMKFCGLIAAAVLCTLCVGQASALEYTVDAPEDYLFGTPTSEGTVYKQESNNGDRGKNTALIPPGFGTATSYLPGSGEPLTPNLLPGAMSGGLISSVKTDSSEVSYPTVDSTADRWTGTSFTAKPLLQRRSSGNFEHSVHRSECQGLPGHRQCRTAERGGTLLRNEHMGRKCLPCGA